jgi:lipopolysaccharide/colanic/teichoic acid biosynthesis glycosyltransferase
MRKTAALGVKRAFDVVGAAVGLLLLSPVLAAAAVAVLATEGRPVFFRQVRPGRDGALFAIVKFRTMRPLLPGEAPYWTDHRRLTPLGRFLRSTSLDELPELWNVLRGEMSLVGPRPLLVEYLTTYTPEQRRRHAVRPGITGWAAVNGRHTTPFEERLKLDVWYVDHWSLWLDLRILALTVRHLLRREDVVATQSIEDIGFPLTDPAAQGEPHPNGTARHGGGS